jgi:hypothetical protein
MWTAFVRDLLFSGNRVAIYPCGPMVASGPELTDALMGSKAAQFRISARSILISRVVTAARGFET